MKTRVIMFLAVFFGVIMCSITVALCGGAKFGTMEFGWVLGTGMTVGAVGGLLAAGLPDYK